jgi:LPS sulfotransferase NodH
MAPYTSYVICTSPRSGSTLLCTLLSDTGIAGHPDSHFHTAALRDWLADYALAPDDFANEHAQLTAVFDAARARGTGDTGIFGLRLQRHSLAFLMQQLSLLYPNCTSDHQRFQAAFANTLFIYLTRADKLDQSISFVKATQTGLWHKAPDGTELERLSPPQDPLYDQDALARTLGDLTAMDEDWKTWFAREQIDPLCIDYDELSARPSEILAQILRKLGLPAEIADTIKPNTAKLSDLTNQIWAQRFRATRDL